MANQGKSWETTCTVALKYNYLYACNKSLPKLTRKDLPYKNRIPPAHEDNLCSKLARSHVLWSVLSRNKSALSLSAINSVCSVQFFVLNHQEPGYLCPPMTLSKAKTQILGVQSKTIFIDLGDGNWENRWPNLQIHLAHWTKPRVFKRLGKQVWEVLVGQVLTGGAWNLAI